MVYSFFSVVSFATFSCVFVISQSANVTIRCDQAGDCSVSGFYKNFLDNVLKINAEHVTEKCKNAFIKYKIGLKGFESDATKMFDATAKLPSGILSGNINQYGDFDECLSVENAQYCLAEIDFYPLWKEPFLKFQNNVHSYYAFKEEFNDPKHRVPGFKNIRWGFCIPSDCTPTDLENSLKENLGVKVQVSSEMCQKRTSVKEHTVGHTIAKYFFLNLIMILVISTVCVHYSVLKPRCRLNKVFEAFALQKNWRRLMATRADDKNEIRAVHGVRFMSALGLIMSHKAMALFYNPYVNRTDMVEHYGLPWSVIGRTAIIYTDSFIFISGLLSANQLFNDLSKGNGMKFTDKLITRIFRISPNIIAVILFCTYILPEWGWGPLWPLVVDHHSTLCKSYMWRNFLYIHNYFGFENMCLTHTHQVGIDMQLFLSTPIFVYAIWLNRKLGITLLILIATLSTILRFWISWQNNLSCLVHFGITVRRMFDTADLSYILPTHRITVYLMGVYTAYILKATPKNTTFSKIKVALLWTLALLIGFSAMMGPFHMAVKDYVYNKLDGACYCAISPIFWGIGVGWTIYASNRGYGGWFGDFLSWKGFQVFTRISYGVYLVQFPVFFYNVGITRHVDQFKPGMLLQFSETLTILLISTILTLSVEMPFQNLKKIIFSGDEHNMKGMNKENKRKDAKVG